MTTPHLEARERLRVRWLRLLRDSRAELDIALCLIILIAEWLAGLPEEVAVSWIELLQKRLVETRVTVS